MGGGQEGKWEDGCLYGLWEQLPWAVRGGVCEIPQLLQGEEETLAISLWDVGGEEEERIGSQLPFLQQEGCHCPETTAPCGGACRGTDTGGQALSARHPL